MSLRAPLFAVALVLAACGTVTDAVIVAAPTNDCPTHVCSAYAQALQTAVCDETHGFCHVNAAPDYTLVVSLPDTASVAPGYTFAIGAGSNEIKTTTLGCPKNAKCVVLPRLGGSGGAFVASSDLASTVKRYLGNGNARTSLPAHVTFRPLGPGAASTARANDVGLPLPTIFANVVTDLPLEPSPRGPGGAPPIGWDAPLPPGRYERTLQPDPPFSDSFPPEVDLVTIAGRPLQQVELSVDTPAQRVFVIDSEGQDLAGWTAEIDDSATRRPISAVATLSSGTNEVTLHTVNRGSLQEIPVELVIRPRAGLAAVPELVFAASPTITRHPTYPAIPVPALVTGRVVSFPEGTPVPSRVFFRSASLKSSRNFPLRYASEVRTDSEARYAVRLPVGIYDVIVVPEESTGYGVVVLSREVTELAVQQGKSLQVVRRPLLSGQARLADGRPLVNAEVEASPSIHVDPPAPYAAMQHVTRGRTDEMGAFSMPVDPGFYDVAIKPDAGTRFPWLVSVARRVDEGGLVLEDQVVRVPFDAGLLLFDANLRVVQGALVRAYAVPEGGSKFAEIGRARSNQDGLFEMFLSPTPPR